MLDCLCFCWRKRRIHEKQAFRGFNDKLQNPNPNPNPNFDAREVKVNPASSFQTRVFNYRELASATRNFHPDSLLGQGGFGSVYKGKLLGTDQIVAVKKLNPEGLQGEKEFLVEVLMFSLLCHSNLINMIGYCVEGTQRLVVLEYMSLGSLEDHLHDLEPDKKALDWNTRMKIAAGAAKGVDYLHNEAKPPVILRDLKPSNILLDQDFHPKLSDFGLAKFGPVGDSSHISATRIMGTHGYCAPEYALTGRLTAKSDTYSFGVVLLELISGRKPLDQNLLDWARPLLEDEKNHILIVDSRLKGKYPKIALHKVISIVDMCLIEDAEARPTMRDVALAMNHLTSDKYRQQHSLTRSPETREPAKMMNRDTERELAIAEAKLWGEKWRDKKHQMLDS